MTAERPLRFVSVVIVGLSLSLLSPSVAHAAKKKEKIDVKEELAEGNPVIIPAAGRDLGNPYFSGKGPWYHALVIIGFRRGWTGRRYFIVNDPGTKRGKSYEYNVETLLNAIHDWTGVKEEIRNGPKVMVVLEK